ncbi:hypothetical protein [Sphingomonas sp. 3-13AW]|uniref:hypothetical protein n=1 Tax=Sphingomonas sp. 3-13AW TaxID=3050450 RepID=UPI003BB4A377
MRLQQAAELTIEPPVEDTPVVADAIAERRLEKRAAEPDMTAGVVVEMKKRRRRSETAA